MTTLIFNTDKALGQFLHSRGRMRQISHFGALCGRQRLEAGNKNSVVCAAIGRRMPDPVTLYRCRR